jgi:uncharacterized protein with PIN domain
MTCKVKGDLVKFVVGFPRQHAPFSDPEVIIQLSVTVGLDLLGLTRWLCRYGRDVRYNTLDQGGLLLTFCWLELLASRTAIWYNMRKSGVHKVCTERPSISEQVRTSCDLL